MSYQNFYKTNKYQTLHYSLFLVFLFICSVSWEQEADSDSSTTWDINSQTSIGGHSTTAWGNPTTIEIAGGVAIEFDGIDDGLLVDNNPLGNTTEFTIELIFMPYQSYPDNIEQRFLHIQDPSDDNKRLLIELRLNDKNQWYLDGFIKAGSNYLTLIDETLVHPVDEWSHVAVTYKDNTFKTFVNGIEELSGTINYQPIGQDGQTSIGVRMNKVSWFKGVIKTIKFTHQELQPSEFLDLSTLNSKGSIQSDEIRLYNPIINSNHSISITYYLPTEQMCILKLHDILGRNIKTIQNSIQSPGRHTINIPVIELPKGIYIIGLNTNQELKTVKFIKRNHSLL